MLHLGLLWYPSALLCTHCVPCPAFSTSWHSSTWGLHVVQLNPVPPLRLANRTQPALPGPQDSATFANMGTIGHAYISVNDADLYIVSGFDAAVGTQAATIRAFVAAGGGLLVGNQVRLQHMLCPLLSFFQQQQRGLAVGRRARRLCFELPSLSATLLRPASGSAFTLAPCFLDQVWSSAGDQATLPVNVLLNPMVRPPCLLCARCGRCGCHCHASNRTALQWHALQLQRIACMPQHAAHTAPAVAWLPPAAAQVDHLLTRPRCAFHRPRNPSAGHTGGQRRHERGSAGNGPS